jgi:hypothetical protein
LFNGDTKLVSAGNLTLPSNVKTDCYNHMFYGCTSLTTAPVLPATTLEAGCYNYMFYRCTSLTAAPALPALNAPRWCYGNMFYGCTSLTTAPALPATTIGDNAYNNMFNGCTSLTTAPTLPATTLSGSCYSYMFKGCTGLTTAPTLPATTLASQCYYNMFNGCTSLTTTPALPATTLAVSCYRGMFISCTGLTTLPTDLLPATALTDSCYYSMFQDCTNITNSPVLHATTLAQYCYRTMFERCKHLNTITTYAQDISATNCLTGWLSGVAATGDFYNEGGATYTVDSPSGIPQGWTEHKLLNYFYVEDISGSNNTLSIKKSGESAPDVEVFYSTDKTNWISMGTTSTTGITATIPANGKLYLKANADAWANSTHRNSITASRNHNVGGNIMSLLYGDSFEYKTVFPNNSSANFKGFLNSNTKLINAKDLVLPAITLTWGCYYSMFNGCNSLTTSPTTLPATTLGISCYRDMFNGCSALTTSPVILATTLTNYSCSYMFYNCFILDNITMYANNISANNCLQNWLGNVASTGDFYNLGGTTYPSGASGIPTGWTEHTTL